MIDHVSLGTKMFDAAIGFYSKCFATIGYSLRHRNDDEAAFGEGEMWNFWLYPVKDPDAIVGARSHVAVTAHSRDEVTSFLEVALREGATALRPAGERPDISPDYFGTVIRDLDGHTVEVVHWEKQKAEGREQR